MILYVFFLCISIVLWWFSMFFSMFFLFFFCGCWLSKPDVSDVSAMFQGFMSFESQGFDVFLVGICWSSRLPAVDEFLG